MKIIFKDSFFCLFFLISSTASIAQNIGIGTNTPIQTLDVNGRLRVANGVIQNGNTPITSTGDLGLYSQTANSWMRLVTNNAPIKFFTENGNGGVGTTAKMVLTENGSLGIGSDNPAGKLHIKSDGETGAEAIDQQQLVTAGAFFATNEFQTFTAGKSGLLKSIALRVGGFDSITIQISSLAANASYILLSTTKTVYAGTKDIGDQFRYFTLSQPVLVTAGKRYKIDFIFPATNKGIIFVKKGTDDGTPYYGGYCSFYLDKTNELDKELWDFAFKTFVTPYSNVDIVVNQGNLGIGTPSPSARLDLAGSFKMTDGSQGAGKILTSDANGLATWASLPAAPINPGTAAGNTPFWNGNTWVTNNNNIFNNGGNVGIGTNAPSALLDVAGTLNANAWKTQSATPNGYANMGGILMQWGTVDYKEHNNKTVTYPVAFTEVFSVTLTLDNNNVGSNGGNIPPKLWRVENSYFELGGTQVFSGGLSKVRWMAVGR